MRRALVGLVMSMVAVIGLGGATVFASDGAATPFKATGTTTPSPANRPKPSLRRQTRLDGLRRSESGKRLRHSIRGCFWELSAATGLSSQDGTSAILTTCLP